MITIILVVINNSVCLLNIADIANKVQAERRAKRSKSANTTKTGISWVDHICYALHMLRIITLHLQWPCMCCWKADMGLGTIAA